MVTSNKLKFKEAYKKKEIDPRKKIELEKGDFLAIIIAVGSIVLPAALILFGLIALFIFGWSAFFG